jgi:hypothetical protein
VFDFSCFLVYPHELVLQLPTRRRLLESVQRNSKHNKIRELKVPKELGVPLGTACSLGNL